MPKTLFKPSLFIMALSAFNLLILAPNAYAHEDEHDEHHEEKVEKIVVQATRSGRIADDQPVRVELINREEIQEKAGRATCVWDFM